MTKIKLSEYAENQGISYITANRHFHAGIIPGAEQLDSGTILVDTDATKNKTSSSEAVSLLLKKMKEYNNIEDFTGYILSNFKLTINEQNTQANEPKINNTIPQIKPTQMHSFNHHGYINCYTPDLTSQVYSYNSCNSSVGNTFTNNTIFSSNSGFSTDQDPNWTLQNYANGLSLIGEICPSVLIDGYPAHQTEDINDEPTKKRGRKPTIKKI